MLPRYNTVLFSDVFPNVDQFINDYNENGIDTLIKEETAKTLYYLLYARYGQTPIANGSIDQFKMRLFSIVFQYGPTWEKRLELQASARALTPEELLQGSKVIYNKAYNPASGDQGTLSLEEVSFINEQTTQNVKRSKVEAISVLWEVLRVDVTKQFLNQFQMLFRKIVLPDRTYIYTDEEEEE